MSGPVQPPQENKMGVMPIRRLLLTMSGPMMVSMLIQALYNVVDSMFVSYISEGALTAVSLAYPMQNLMIAVATGTGVGVNALLSRNLGEKNFEMANRAAGNAIFLGVVSFAVFALVGAVGSRLYFAVQVDDPEIIAYGVDYLSVIMVLSVGCFGQVLLSRLLQSTGKTFYSMVIQLVGAGLNIVLDPIMIFGLLGCPAMGVAGAALATVISQVAGTILGLYYNLRKNPEIRFAWTYLRPSKPVIARIYGVGIPSILLQTVSSLLIFGLNQILVVFSETATAVYGVYFKLQGFAFLPIIGMNNGMVPIIAYNYGAKKPDRVKRTIKLAVLSAMGIMAVGFAVFEIAPGALLSFFDASENMLAIGAPALRIIALSFILAGFCIIAGSVCQAIGNPFYSLIVSVCRQLVVLLPVAWLLSQTGNLTLVWLAFPIAELMSLTLSIIFLRKTLRMADAAMASGKAGA